MEHIKTGDEEFLGELETAIRGIIKNRKSKPEHKLAAINAGVRLAAIRHRIDGGLKDDEGFFGK